MTEWPRWIDSATLCRYADMHRNSIPAMERKGMPIGVMRGGKRFWDRLKIDAWMEGGSAKVEELTLVDRIRQSAREAANGR